MEPTIEELRRWSAEELMGWQGSSHYPTGKRRTPYGDTITFSHKTEWLPDRPETGQIWMVVERMIKMGYTFVLYRFIGPPIWIAKFMKIDEWRNEGVDPCLAILKAAHAAAKGGPK